MSFIGAIERSFANLSVTDPKAWNPSLWNLYGSQSVTGENVNESTALTYSAVWNANYILSTTISTLPLFLNRAEPGKTIKAKEESLYRVMHSEFNPYMTAQVGREVLMSHVLLWGNGYAEIVRNGKGDIIELWPITPDRVRIDATEDGKLFYWIRVGSEDKPLAREKILHVPGLGFDGYQGYSVISMARKSIGLSMAMETYGSLFFANGTHPSAVITHPQKIVDDKLRKALLEAYSGLGQSHRMMLLEDGMTIQDIGIPPEDAQFLQSRVFQVSEIARWFNLPLHKLKEMERATNNNIESEQISFVTDTNLPWLIRFEQNYDQQLLTSVQKNRKRMFFRHNVDGLLRGNAKDRAMYYRIMVDIGAMSLNDVRVKENMDLIAHEFADDHFVQLNRIPITMLREYLEKQNTSPASIPVDAQEETNNANKQNILSLIPGVKQ